MLYISIIAKSPLYLTIIYLFFNKIQKKQLIKATYLYLNHNSRFNNSRRRDIVEVSRIMSRLRERRKNYYESGTDF
ncbi:hypothetical protein CEP21_00875 (plasmid) [Bacillus anthracis]|nr:hypothetical protein B2J90_30295 [Bacillus cereus]MRR92048.1 hypothetical protein [Bacillus anthracis]TYC45822.1 hypothetical protein CEP21_00875 [Bacillus anthracis]